MSYSPSLKGVYIGTFATEKALTDSVNPTKVPGSFALVGTGPYRILYAEGSNWIDHHLRTQGDDLLDANGISVRNRMDVARRNYILSSLEAPVIIPPRLQVGANGAIQFGTLVSGTTITFSATSGTGVTCTASAAFFTSAAVDVNKYISLPTGEWAQVTAFTSTTVVTVSILTAGPALKGTVGPYSNWYYGHGTAAVYGHPGYSNVARAALGCWMYFKAGALYAGSAADTYWVVMRSPMTGTAFNTTPDNGFGRLPLATPQRIISPAMGEQAHAAGDVFFGGATAIPFGAVGPNGNVICTLAGTASTSALTKYVIPYYGNSSSGRPSSTTAGGFVLRTRWSARGSHSILSPAQGWSGETDVTGHGNASNDIAGGKPTFRMKGNSGGPDDYITIENLRLEIDPGPSGGRALRSPATLPITVPADFMGMNLMQPGYSGNALSLVSKVGVNRLNQSRVSMWAAIETAAGVYNPTILSSLGAIITAIKAKGGKIALGLYATPTFYAGTTPHPTYTDAQTLGPWGYLGECSNPTSTTAVVNFVTYMINYFNKPGGAWYEANGGKKGIDYWETWNEPENYTDSNQNSTGVGAKGKQFWWGSSTQLVDLCKLQYDLIKSLDSSIVIWSPGFASTNANAQTFLACQGTTYSSTTGADTFDQFSFHTYSAAPPGETTGVGNGDILTNLTGLYEQVTALRTQGYNFPLTIGEIGFDPDALNSAAWYAKSAADRYTYWCRVAMVCAAWGIKSILPWHWTSGNTTGTAGNWGGDVDGCTKAYNDIQTKLCGKTIVSYSYENNSPVRLDFSDGTYWVV